MVDDIKKQIQYFNKVTTLFIVILSVMSVIIASNMVNTLYNASVIESLDNMIRGTLEEYAPDREKTALSRETIKDINETTTEILGLVK